MDYVVRFVAGGLIVSAFAILGDLLRPKSFAGLFGAAPSIALATLTMAAFRQGNGYVSIEGRSMFLGAIALSLYCVVVCQLLMRFRFSAVTATESSLFLWLRHGPRFQTNPDRVTHDRSR
jgi:Protein of unknown function (DUF3147)